MADVAIHLDATLDGQPIPGFPYTRLLECSGILAFTNHITSTASYVDVLTGHIPPSAQTITVLLVSPSVAGNIVVLDDSDTVPIPIGANDLFAAFNLDTATSSSDPLVKFKASTNPTDLFVVVGFR